MDMEYSGVKGQGRFYFCGTEKNGELPFLPPYSLLLLYFSLSLREMQTPDKTSGEEEIAKRKRS